MMKVLDWAICNNYSFWLVRGSVAIRRMVEERAFSLDFIEYGRA